MIIIISKYKNIFFQAMFTCHIDFSCMVTSIHWFHEPDHNHSSSLIKVTISNRHGQTR